MSAGLCVSEHPLIKHKLTILRNLDTSPHDFRRLLKEITFYLGYEATRTIQLTTQVVSTSNGDCTGYKVCDKVAVIPILRAGLVMVDAMLDLIPKAAVHHIGMYKTKTSSLPVMYYNRLPKKTACDVAFICDVCIGTAATMSAVVSVVKRWGAKRIVVLAAIGSESGVKSLMDQHTDIQVVVGAIDPGLSEDGIIIPGIGDAGDRLYGTPLDEMAATALANDQDEKTEQEAKKLRLNSNS